MYKLWKDDLDERDSVLSILYDCTFCIRVSMLIPLCRNGDTDKLKVGPYFVPTPFFALQSVHESCFLFCFELGGGGGELQMAEFSGHVQYLGLAPDSDDLLVCI